MEMQTNIRDEIKRMTKIQLKQDNFIGKGAYASVYRYNIHKTQLAVKCFEDLSKAEEENALIQKIYELIPNCPGIIQYYGIQKLDIEIIGQLNGDYNGYAIFFTACLLDFQKLFAIVKKLQIKEDLNLQTFILQFIRFFNQPIHINIQQQIPSFKSDILINPYSSIILMLFEQQSIQLSRIHAQFNIQDDFNCKTFHQNCDHKGSTLVIMHSNDEPNSFFGGMAAPSWNSDYEWMDDPVSECSWLFKIEVEESMLHLHQWKSIKKNRAIFGHPKYGPSFGIRNAGFGLYGYEYYGYKFGGKKQGYSAFPFNKHYEKIDLNNKTMSFLTLPFQLRSQINCSQKVQRAIMNKKQQFFDLDSYEVFAIKK